MELNTSEKTLYSIFHLPHLTNEVSKAKALVNDVIDDGTRKAKRAVVAAEECVEETTYYIKRHPWQSVGLAAGLGVGTGLLASWVHSRATQGCTKNGRAEFQVVER